MEYANCSSAHNFKKAEELLEAEPEINRAQEWVDQLAAGMSDCLVWCELILTVDSYTDWRCTHCSRI